MVSNEYLHWVSTIISSVKSNLFTHKEVIRDSGLISFYRYNLKINTLEIFLYLYVFAYFRSPLDFYQLHLRAK